MNDKKCKYCAMMIPKEAKICPHCRKKLVILTLPVKIILVILLIPLTLWLYADFRAYFGVTSPSSVKDATYPDAAKLGAHKGYSFNGYTLNKREQTVLEALLIDDLIGYVDGKESHEDMTPIWQHEISTIVAANVNADKLQRDYEKNEVAGDQKYRGKKLLVSGIIKSIDRSAGENYFLSLAGGSNMFISPKAKMADGFKNYLAGLEKGQTVNLLCQGDGMLIGSAMLNKCIPRDIFIENVVNNWVANNITKQFSEGKKVIQQIVIASITLASLLPESSDCFKNDNDKQDKCMSEIENSLKDKKMFESKRNLVTEKLKLDFNKIFDKKAASNIAGTWEGSLDGDGEMVIKQLPTGFDVTLSVSSSSGCSGSIEGSGSLSGDTLTLTKKEDNNVCTITIKFDGHEAKINEDNCSPYHGVACGFSGTLKKVN